MNCGTDELPRRWLGYCNRCAPYARLLTRCAVWNPDDMRTWMGFWREDAGAAATPRPVAWKNDFCTARDYIALVRDECEIARKVRKHVEEELRGEQPVEPITMEFLFIHMSKMLGTPVPRNSTADHIGRLDEPVRKLVQHLALGLG